MLLSFLDKNNLKSNNLVGYHIGMEANYKSFSKIIFATNGIFLNYLVHNPEVLNDYSHVVLDEVHERDLDMDFILILLRCLASEFPHLKIILMSATLNSNSLATYFSPKRLDLQFMLDFQEKILQEVKLRNVSKFNKEESANSDKAFGCLKWKFEDQGIKEVGKEEPCHDWGGKVVFFLLRFY